MEGGGADASELDGGATDFSTLEMLPQELRNIATKARVGRSFMLEIVMPGSTFALGFDCTSTPVVEPNSLFKEVAPLVGAGVFLRAAMKVALGGWTPKCCSPPESLVRRGIAQ